MSERSPESDKTELLHPDKQLQRRSAAPPGTAHPRPPERSTWAWILGAALLLGLVRFVRLGEWSLWIDEAHTLHDALARSGAAPEAYPLGYMLTAAFVGLCGGSTEEWVLRLGPAVLGWLALPLAFWAFAPFAGRERAAAVALLLAVSPWHIFWSQSARAYTLAADLSLLGGGLVLRGLFTAGPTLLLPGLLITASAAFAHPSGALLLPAWIVAPLVLGPLKPVPELRRRSIWLLCAVGALALLAIAGWGREVWEQYQGSKARSLAQMLSSVEHLAKTTGYYFTPLASAAAVWGAWIAWRRRAAVDLLAVLLCLLVLALAVAAATRVVVSAQYVFALLPWFFLLATAPLRAHALPSPRLRLAGLGLLVLPMLVETGLYLSVRHGDRPRWREAYAAAFEHKGPNDLVLGMMGPVGERYLDPSRRDVRSQRAMVTLSAYQSGVPEPWLRTDRRVWLVVNHEDLASWPREEREAFSAYLREECRAVERFRVPLTPRDLDVVLYVRD